jgi:glutathione S-transferase
LDTRPGQEYGSEFGRGARAAGRRDEQETTMKVYGHPFSTCTRKVLCTLAEKGKNAMKGEGAEFVLVDLMKGEHKQPEYLERQPFGQVPALDDDGFRLYESRAICRYLDATLPGPRLVPTDPKGMALVEQWISNETSNFTAHAMKIVYQRFFNPMRGNPIDEKVVAEGLAGVERALPIMEKQLAKTEFIAGNAFSLADISFLPYIEYLYASKVGDVIERHERVGAWWKKISERPSWKIAAGK